MSEGVKERLIQYLKYKGISQNRFAEIIGVSSGYVNNIRKSIQPDKINSIAKCFPDVNTGWIMTGMGEMLNNAESKEIRFNETKKSNSNIKADCFNLYNIEAAANLCSIFVNKDENVVGQIMIPNIPKCDGALYVRGDSMEPVLKSGDIVAFKQVQADPRSIVYGEMYIISFDMNGDDYVAVKIVDRSDNGPEWIRLISYNDYYKPMDVELCRVRAIAMVKLSIRMHTMV